MPNTEAIRFAETGGPEVLQITEVELAEPGPGQALVGVFASGVNFIDTYHRSGLYPVDLPCIPGSEGAGIVEAVGADVTDVAVGDRVAWVGVPGSYAGRVLAPTEALMPIPDGVSLEIAAALPLQGMTAHYLTHSTYELHSGQVCLVHAAAGGVGLLLCQLGRRRGARVIGTVSTAEKAEAARAAGAAERLVELLHQESDIPDRGSSPIPHGQALVAKGLGFTYPARPENPALSDFNLTIAPGKTLALVGPSGAGKSTLFELLQRFHDPSEGALTYGDIALADFPLQDWRSKAALVPQAPILFSGDIAYNIAYGNPDASQADIEAAANAAYAQEFIERLPQGYQSEIGAQGVQLSGGQRQRIALARAILKNPEILLLDEATSALDTESEYYVQLALGELTKGRTTIIIAHRLSTIINADAIAVIDSGSVVDVGTHSELLTRCDLYQRLASMQFKETPAEEAQITSPAA